MFASSFGLPVPEEITLISAGLVAYMGMHPDKYPPPTQGGEPVNLYFLATLCFVAVLSSDFLIYLIGKKYGRPLLSKPRFQKILKPHIVAKVEKWVKKYGAWASGIFRFTPGLRFPGHMMCGVLGLSPYRFLAVDGTAALLSVPTQIILVAYYGRQILSYVSQFKYVMGALILIIIAGILVKKFLLSPKNSATAT